MRTGSRQLKVQVAIGAGWSNGGSGPRLGRGARAAGAGGSGGSGDSGLRYGIENMK